MPGSLVGMEMTCATGAANLDILIGLIGWRYVLKPYIAHRQAQAVAQDHELHGIEAHANDVEESGEPRATDQLGAPGARGAP